MREYPWAISRVKEILENSRRNKRNKMLDIGSGDSPLAPFLAKEYGIDVIGIDADSQELYYTLEHARIIERTENSSIAVSLADARKLPFLDSSFDFIASVSVFEHIPERGDSEAFREALRVLKPNGNLLLTIPYSSQYLEYSKKDRHYNARAVSERFLQYLNEYDCQLIEAIYMKQRYFPFYPYYFRLPLFIRALFNPLFPIWSRIFLKTSRQDEENLILCFLWIRKGV